MDDIYIDLFSRQVNDRDVFDIKVENNTNEKLLYKILIGREGVWEALDEEFVDCDEFFWNPIQKGSYHIIAEAKKLNSIKAFDYKASRSITVGINDESLIRDVDINKDVFEIGEKIEISVDTNKALVMYRYFISSNEGWRLIRDYTPDNKLNFTANEPGNFEILIECKEPDSNNNFDDYETLNFTVNNIANVEVVNFQCLAGELLCGEELIFKVDANFEDDRTGLYKFVKVNPDGSTICIQDYSSRNMVSFTENESGEYKLMCYIRDMYSTREFDDRALMVYKIKPYRDINLKSLTTDVISPAVVGDDINIKAIVTGGKDLRYRFKIEGPHFEESGYRKDNNFVWNAKSEGYYKIVLWVKDESCPDDYELEASINFIIEADVRKTIRITNINMEHNGVHLVGKPIKVSVDTDRVESIKYAFEFIKDGRVVYETEYGDYNWAEFIPEESGFYDVSIKVKDKYSHKEYDTHSLVHLEVKLYNEAKIDHILVPAKDYFLVGDHINIEPIVTNTSETLMRYVTTINGHIVEETDFANVEKLIVTPKCPGKYVVQIYVKNVKCLVGFDSKREVKFYVNEAPPITNTTVFANKTLFKINEEISFNVNSEGGKGTCYEFYIMKNGNWELRQRYSRKKYYLFRPFAEGEYRVLVLAKSHYKKCAYEDYGIFEFRVEE